MSTQLAHKRRDMTPDSETSDRVEIDPLPTSMETSGPKLVYLYLQVVEETTLEDLAETLDMKMLTLYPTLGSLEAEGLIERDGETFAVAA